MQLHLLGFLLGTAIDLKPEKKSVFLTLGEQIRRDRMYISSSEYKRDT